MNFDDPTAVSKNDEWVDDRGSHRDRHGRVKFTVGADESGSAFEKKWSEGGQKRSEADERRERGGRQTDSQ